MHNFDNFTKFYHTTYTLMLPSMVPDITSRRSKVLDGRNQRALRLTTEAASIEPLFHDLW
ncbi:hypothetical protein PAXRUDRAFT_830480 [Paxillus rubicundulus Ve08.2h10]|uniref:Uncharacterized protein n=1 Tax=Paxillus rubicundulus Ve08.2h10 TaxID=930991 RepID=A0A0D0D5C8_9AGAM|nr:hypothetical protein PAXRUDRAFT_830480 [Paxillus rubicundulus Ve08.2h10]